MNNENKVKSGYCAIIGKPNVGKSTLMNIILGEKISIITSKPQTTRKRVLGIFNDKETQIIFLDTPGVMEPKYLLHEKMLEYVKISVKDADVLLFMVDASSPDVFNEFFDDERIIEFLKQNKPKILALNKIDLTDENTVKHIVRLFEEKNIFEKIIPISAIGGFNVSTLINTIAELLPYHPKFFPDDQISDAPERFFVSEIIREKIFEQYKEEIPYSTEVEIEEFKERDEKKDYIRASIIVERETQKPIIIGAKGEKIKKLGQRAREEIEAFLMRPVYLELRVKVRPKWRQNSTMLRRFGYSPEG